MDAENGVQAGRKITTAAGAQAVPVARSFALVLPRNREWESQNRCRKAQMLGMDGRGSVVKEGERDGGGGGGQEMEGQGREAEEK